VLRGDHLLLRVSMALAAGDVTFEIKLTGLKASGCQAEVRGYGARTLI